MHYHARRFSVIAAAGLFALCASYVMLRATSRSGPCSLIAGPVLVVVTFFCAILIGLVMTSVWPDS
jgi:hypothetical protein